jgi:hypothetical protein
LETPIACSRRSRAIAEFLEENKMSPEAKLLHFQPLNNKPAATRPVRVGNEKFGQPEPRDFPIAASVPNLPAAIRDEVLDLYAFLFCQRGFRQLGMTFEQFLLVMTTLRPGDLTATTE